VPVKRTSLLDVIPEEKMDVKPKYHTSSMDDQIEDFKKDMENNKRWTQLNKTLAEIQSSNETLKINIDNNLNLLDEKVNFIGRSLMDMKSHVTTSSLGNNFDCIKEETKSSSSSTEEEDKENDIKH
jgi:hypothetical protein